MSDVIFNKKLIIGTLIAVCLIASITMIAMKQHPFEETAITKYIIGPSLPTKSQASRFITQRNTLSKLLNQQKMIFGQQSCQMIALRKKAGEKIDENVSANGGWCEEISGSDSVSHRFDEGFAKALSKFLKGKLVASFGDGPGDYKKALDSYKEVAGYTAYDGAPFCEKTTEGKVQFLDFTGPSFGLNAFDWVVSVEVGEHIPAKYEDVYLDNLARHAKEGIILSWAVLGQGGLSHVNNRPLEHVISQMEKRGFRINKESGAPLREASQFGWLKNNIHVYHRIDALTFNPEDV